MMGIYIKGMEMPIDEPTRIILYPNGQAIKANAVDYEEYEAIPVPPHGRLIDADALRQSIKESIDECHEWADEVEGGEMYARVSQALGTFVECSLRVKAAPTVIPAEREDE